MSPKNLAFFSTAGLVLILDQATKYLAARFLDPLRPLTLIEGLLNLSYLRNRGAAFGLLADMDASLRIPIFLGVTVVAFFLLWRYFRRIPKGEVYLPATVALIFAGAVGNLMDRIRSGEVIDFIDLHLRSYHWPAFNLADMSITAGAALLILHLIRKG